MKRNLQNDKLVMKIIRKQTCKMITQDYDKSVSKKQESGLKWLIIFLGKVCSARGPKTSLDVFPVIPEPFAVYTPRKHSETSF